MPSLLIHNGNHTVKNIFAAKKKSQIYPCVADAWNDTDLKQLSQRIAAVKKSDNGCTDISCADNIVLDDKIKLLENFTTYKFFTSYQNDLDNLDPAFAQTQYDQTQWLRASMWYLSLSDYVVFLDQINLPCESTGGDIVFTPGRVGTHLLKDLSKVRRHVHHNDDILTSDRWKTLVHSSRIYTVARRNFLEYLLSDCVGQKYGIMVTTKDTLQQHTAIVNTWEPFEISQAQCIEQLKTFISYVDFILCLKYLYNKPVYFSVYEDLSRNKTNTYVKNPYNSKYLCSNLEQVLAWCEQIYQPIYCKALANLERVLSTIWYHNE